MSRLFLQVGDAMAVPAHVQPLAADSRDPKKFLRVDPDRVFEALCELPVVHQAQSEKLADARATLRRCQDLLDLECSRIFRAMRRNPQGTLGAAKYSHALARDMLPAVESYRAVQKSLREAQHTVDVLEGVVFAVISTRTALDKLSDAILKGFLGTPTASDLSQAEHADAVRRRRATRK